MTAESGEEASRLFHIIAQEIQQHYSVLMGTQRQSQSQVLSLQISERT